jgi:GT2 family glycosyltransferase
MVRAPVITLTADAGPPARPGGEKALTPVDGISVVVPTLGRVDLVSALLDSCATAAGCYPGPVEVTVVDSSPDDVASRIAALCHSHGARFVRGPDRVGSKRNVGTRLSRHDVVLFIDSDCVADPGLFVEHARAYAASDVGAVIGLTTMQGQSGLLWRILGRSREYNIPYSWPRYFSELPWGATANFSVRRSVFSMLGGFDDATWTWSGGEDVDLGVRVWRSGFRIVASDSAVVRHAREPIGSAWQVMAKLIRYGHADGWLCAKYPDRVRPRLNVVATLVLVVAVAAALAPITGFSALPLAAGVLTTLLMWTLTVLSRWRLPGPDPHLEPLAVLIDCAFDAGTLVGALRHGRPLAAFRRFRYMDEAHLRLRPQYPRIPPAALAGYGAATAAAPAGVPEHE